MPTIYCPDKNCPGNELAFLVDYSGTKQCGVCRRVFVLEISKGIVSEARFRVPDVQLPTRLAPDLAAILREAMACAEVGSHAGAVVLCGLFLEGLFQNAGFVGDNLAQMIEKANQSKRLTKATYHAASASRFMRNIGAHYSADLLALSARDVRAIFDLVIKVAEEMV